MASVEMRVWEERFENVLRHQTSGDASHGLDHVKRVVRIAKRLGNLEGAEVEVVVPAAWLHDCVMIEKDSPDRARASTLAADRALEYLLELQYPHRHLKAVHHAIRSHSFSAGIAPETLEAAVVQDADRLDALGAVGIARCFTVGGRLGLPLYDEDDPFCRAREADDRHTVLDHFFVKLLRLPESMRTESGRVEAKRRVRIIEAFLAELAHEIGADETGERERR
ncbi:MAG: HD domain-containing protein [Acidobacteriota bacterium]|nr:HD domain-containing protein [Acidobacteriota bacterium]